MSSHRRALEVLLTYIRNHVERIEQNKSQTNRSEMGTHTYKSTHIYIYIYIYIYEYTYIYIYWERQKCLTQWCVKLVEAVIVMIGQIVIRAIWRLAPWTRVIWKRHVMLERPTRSQWAKTPTLLYSTPAHPHTHVNCPPCVQQGPQEIQVRHGSTFLVRPQAPWRDASPPWWFAIAFARPLPALAAYGPHTNLRFQFRCVCW